MDQRYNPQTRGTVNNEAAIIDTPHRKYLIIPAGAEALETISGDWVFSNGPTPEWRDLKETDEVRIYRLD